MLAALRAQWKSAAYKVAPTRLLRRGPATGRRIALTFDDGPDDLTVRYLDLLDELDVPATFFIQGLFAERHPHLVRDYVRRGHQLGGHGFDHQRFSRLSIRALEDQVTRTDAAMPPQLTTGRSWVRPPHGDLSLRSLTQLWARGYVVAMWSLDSNDYRIHDADELAAQLTPAHVHPGDVILMHEGQAWTLAALPEIVRSLRADGYEFVTMADLFRT